MKVLLIHENDTFDPHITKPVIERIFRDLDQRVTLTPVQNPKIHGVDQALRRETLEECVQRYPMMKLFLVLVDRDGKEGRALRAQELEASWPDKLVVTLAVEEVEVWMLALHRESLDVPWREVREEHHPKERFAEPLLKSLGLQGSVGGGRKEAMRALGQGYDGLLKVCPELNELRSRLERLFHPA